MKNILIALAVILGLAASAQAGPPYPGFVPPQHYYPRPYYQPYRTPYPYGPGFQFQLQFRYVPPVVPYYSPYFNPYFNPYTNPYYPYGNAYNAFWASVNP